MMGARVRMGRRELGLGSINRSMCWSIVSLNEWG